MVGCASSDTKKAQIVRNVMDALYTQAVAAHLHEKGKGPGEAKAGLRKICKVIEAEYFAETQKTVKLSSSTLCQLANGRMPKSQSNALKG